MLTRRQANQTLAALPLLGIAPAVEKKSALVFDDCECVASFISKLFENRFGCRSFAVTDELMAKLVMQKASNPFDVVFWGGSAQLSHPKVTHVLWSPPVEFTNPDCDLKRYFTVPMLVEKISEVTGWQCLLKDDK